MHVDCKKVIFHLFKCLKQNHIEYFAFFLEVKDLSLSLLEKKKRKDQHERF